MKIHIQLTVARNVLSRLALVWPTVIQTIVILYLWCLLLRLQQQHRVQQEKNVKNN